MGCISSKCVGRSMSIHDRFNQGFHALTIGEDFHMTSSRRDRIITLIKIASGKNLTGFRYSDSHDEINSSCTKPCLILNEEQDTKSVSSDPTMSNEIPNLEHKQTDQCSVLNRPFHTLEEFEALLEKVKLFEARIVESAHDKIESESVRNDSSDTQIDESAGWKRRAMSRELKSLKLPSSAKAELLSVGSLKEWINAGDDIYSPETYVTPKFGSYANRSRSDEFGMFSPELVAAFEECMRLMDAEEACIVKQMEDVREDI